ncbi:MAG: magnesium transporter [Candidatus Bathyarchaeia archaeon]|nr:magnesium transporter [Candidatus Bathyarchaeota archaeon]
MSGANNVSRQDSFSKTFRECLLSFNFDFIGLIAGIILSSQLHIFRLAPWAIAVYPAVLSTKGMIGGMFAGRLSTALHVGTVYPRFLRNTRIFHRIFAVTIVITLIASLFMSLVATALGILIGNVDAPSSLNIILAATATMSLGTTILLLTMLVSFLSFKRGLDPDVIVYPVMSTTADVIITVYYLIILIIFFSGSTGRIAIAAISTLYALITILMLSRNIGDREFLKDIKETILTLIIVSFIVNFTGAFLGEIGKLVEDRREIYTVYPALIDMIGDVGSVVGSITTTRLALGLLKPSLKSMGGIRDQISGSWLASIIIFIALSLLSLILNGLLEPLAFISLTLTLIMTNIIAIPVIVAISYIVSILTFKRGLDPDNFVIPIESSLADNITTIALLITILLTY